MSDPVQAAIERAKAKAAGNASTDPMAEAQAKLEGLQKRLTKAEDKLKNAQASEDPNLAAFESSVEKLKSKIAEAQKAMPAAATEKATPAAPAVDMSDPVQAAIARAQAKRDGASTEDPKAKLEKNIANFKKRLAASEEKLKTAQAEGLDTVDAFKTAVEKTAEKLHKAEAELAQLTADQTPSAKEETPAPAVDMNDPIQAAIARAQEKRANAEALDPKAKLEQDIISLQKRIDKSDLKLQKAKDENADTVEILETSMQKLKDKLASAQQELSEL